MPILREYNGLAVGLLGYAARRAGIPDPAELLARYNDHDEDEARVIFAAVLVAEADHQRLRAVEDWRLADILCRAIETHNEPDRVAVGLRLLREITRFPADPIPRPFVLAMTKSGEERVAGAGQVLVHAERVHEWFPAACRVISAGGSRCTECPSADRIE